MKPHHAASVALLGWYLILPPMNHRRSTDGAWWTDIRAKLKDWQIVESFDEVADCEIRDKTIEDSGKHKWNLGSSYQRAFRIAESQAQCIASDDPQLKAK